MNRLELDRGSEVHRPLVSRTGLGALSAGVLVVLCLLLPMAVRRQNLALELLPDALSLVYLDLNLARHPNDAELRYRVAHKTLQAGRFDDARATLAPLLQEGSPLLSRAQALRLDIDRQAWAAIDPRSVKARADALARVIAGIDAIDLSDAPPVKVQEFAKLFDSLAQPKRAAELLDRLARRKLSAVETHLADAEAAHLRADQSARAIDLQVFFAETSAGPAAVRHALRALELAPAALNPRDAFALAETLRAKLGPNEPQLVAASLAFAKGADVRLAYRLAQRMSRAQPADAGLHRRVARLAEANGDSLRALDEYVWLTRNGGRADDRARAIELARANWDLPLLRELLADTRAAPARAARATRTKRRGRGRLSAVGHTSATRHACGPTRSATSDRLERRRAALRETLGLYEALGDTDAALAAVGAALASDLAADEQTRAFQVELLKRSGQLKAAAESLTALVQRFPSPERALELAHVRLSLGQPREALTALQAGPKPWSEAYLRQLLELAWELGDLPLARTYAARVVQLPAASAWDVARLWQLQRTDPDPQVPLATALAGFERFKNAEMLRLVIDSAARENDGAKVARFLAQAESFGGFRTDPSYWQQRITLHQRLAFEAFTRQEFVAAKRELRAAEKALERAPELAPADGELYQELWTSQYAQVLSVALEAGDRAALAAVFDRYGAKLPVRQRVYVLHRLDRHAEAFELARLGAQDPTLSDSDRAALRADRPAEAAAAPDGGPDYVRAHSEFLNTEGLRLWTHTAELAIDSEQLGLGFAASYGDLAPQRGLRTLQPSAAREIGTELTGRVYGTELTGGVRMRQDDGARPYGTLRQRMFGDRDTGLSASVSMNAQSFESSQLRLLGTTDESALQGSVAFGSGYYLSARAAGNRYLTLERDYLGAGLSVDAGVGRSMVLPDEFGRVALRATGRFAPRWRGAGRDVEADARMPATWVPESTGFAGVGASLARGELAIPAASDPAFRFLLDGSIGVLFPTQRVGWTGQAGVGSEMFGRDQLSAELVAGNVVGSEMFWVVQAGYAVGLE